MQRETIEFNGVRRQIRRSHQIKITVKFNDINDNNPQFTKLLFLPDQTVPENIDSKTESADVTQCATSPVPPSPETQKSDTIVNFRRRRSRSAYVVEPDYIYIKQLPIVPESRIIASLNPYKSGDKMPKRPTKTYDTAIFEHAVNVKLSFET